MKIDRKITTFRGGIVSVLLENISSQNVAIFRRINAMLRMIAQFPGECLAWVRRKRFDTFCGRHMDDRKDNKSLVSEIIHAEITLVQHIIDDEMWLEAERRHEPVGPEDKEVMSHVIDIILREGDRIFSEATRIVMQQRHTH